MRHSTRTTSPRPAQAIVEYRAAQGIRGPLFIGRDTHALSRPAFDTALEVLVGNDVAVQIDSLDGYTPTPAVSHAILTHNRGRAANDPGRADGIVVTPARNPPRDGGFKYNPPHGGPADTDATGWIASRANQLLRDGLREVHRHGRQKALQDAGRYDFLNTYVKDLPNVVDIEAIRRAGVRIGADPLGGAGGIIEVSGPRSARCGSRSHRGQSRGGSALVVHDPGSGREDPHGLLEPVGNGLAAREAGRVRHRHRQ